MELPLNLDGIHPDVQVSVDSDGKITLRPMYRIADSFGTSVAFVTAPGSDSLHGAVDMRALAEHAIALVHQINTLGDSMRAALVASRAASRSPDDASHMLLSGERTLGDPAILKLTLDAMGIWEGTFENKADFAQSAIYLLQAAGTDLGYTFSVFEEGPAALELYKDFLAISEVRPVQYQALVLRPEAQEHAERVRSMLEQKPNHISRANWCTLLAAWHYFAQVQGMDEEDIVDSLLKRWESTKREEATLFTKQAKHALLEARLITW